MLTEVGNLVNHVQVHYFQMLGDLMENITEGTPAWELTWTAIAYLSWLIWRERNLRCKENRVTLHEELFHNTISMTDITF